MQIKIRARNKTHKNGADKYQKEDAFGCNTQKLSLCNRWSK